jgi:hypothetical protein
MDQEAKCNQTRTGGKDQGTWFHMPERHVVRGCRRIVLALRFAVVGQTGNESSMHVRPNLVKILAM